MADVFFQPGETGAGMYSFRLLFYLIRVNGMIAALTKIRFVSVFSGDLLNVKINEK